MTTKKRDPKKEKPAVLLQVLVSKKLARVIRAKAKAKKMRVSPYVRACLEYCEAMNAEVAP